MMRKMKISVGTKNKAKLDACDAILHLAFDDVSIVAHDVPSGIAAMPMTNEDTAQGAVNRAHAALDADPDAELGIGLEGGVYEGPLRRMYLLGWAAIVSRDGTIGIGHSAAVALPEDIADELRSGAELGPLMQTRMGDVDNEIRHSLGTTGLLTNGLYPRNREFEDALRNAVASFVAPEFYNR